MSRGFPTLSGVVEDIENNNLVKSTVYSLQILAWHPSNYLGCCVPVMVTQDRKPFADSA
jgi:hypothetical protein